MAVGDTGAASRLPRSEERVRKQRVFVSVQGGPGLPSCRGQGGGCGRLMCWAGCGVRGAGRIKGP